MRINCPHCGLRDLAEFTYHGDARHARTRPEPSSKNTAAWNTWVYDRENPAGTHEELWQHIGGCRAFVRVMRNTVTHEIEDVKAL